VTQKRNACVSQKNQRGISLVAGKYPAVWGRENEEELRNSKNNLNLKLYDVCLKLFLNLEY